MSEERTWVVVDEGGGWHLAEGCRLRRVSQEELDEARVSGRVPGSPEDDLDLLGILTQKPDRG